MDARWAASQRVVLEFIASNKNVLYLTQFVIRYTNGINMYYTCLTRHIYDFITFIKIMTLMWLEIDKKSVLCVIRYGVNS
ncbi:hypothetical protein HanRHA438_Chr11g0530261 [Helianthus annuus]|nr:hypothetical protein HanIR_Chr11g0557931 [Helianthus annuus]KAJ0873016.1 hypothetical protein HanRHA438_Chr11g0530261 [Helianthus annuus]